MKQDVFILVARKMPAYIINANVNLGYIVKLCLYVGDDVQENSVKNFW